MGVLAVNRAETRAAVAEVAGTLADMIRPLADTSIRIPGAEWTVGEAANHVASAARLFVDLANGVQRAHGDETKEGLAAANAEWLARDPERSGARLADVIVENTRVFLDSVESRPPGQQVRTPSGPMDLDTFMSYLLTHTAMHAFPIARALHKPRPVRKEHVALMLPFLAIGMKTFVFKEKTKDLTASFLLHLRGGPQLAVTFDKGALTVGTTPARRVDCHISADPISLFLVGVGLKSQWGPIATGKLMTWGTKPWLALQFVGFFATP